jgi:hypothetical protein
VAVQQDDPERQLNPAFIVIAEQIAQSRARMAVGLAKGVADIPQNRLRFLPLLRRQAGEGPDALPA